MDNFIQGNLVRIKCTFQDLLGVDTDPTTVTAKVEDPAKTVNTYVYLTDPEVVRETTGVYYIDVNLNQGGIWHYRFEGEGDLKAASQDSLKCIAENP